MKDHFFSTQIGIATFNANFNPQVALDINKDLSENLSQGIVLSSHFHLLYNCVQMDVEVTNLDWNLFHNEVFLFIFLRKLGEFFLSFCRAGALNSFSS